MSKRNQKQNGTLHMYKDLFYRLDPNTMRAYKNMTNTKKSSTTTYSVDKSLYDASSMSRPITTMNTDITLNSRLDTKNSYFKKTKQPYAKENREVSQERQEQKLESYAKYVEMRIQTTYPLPRTERRFKWQDPRGLPMDPELNPKIGIKRRKIENEFDGGFQWFFNNPNKMNHKIEEEDDKKDLLKKTFGVTKRVINPEENVIINILINID